MTMPNFFIIGAGSCGTTSIDAYLRQHPQIFMSSIKEPHFFSMPDQGSQTISPLEGHKRRGGCSMSWEEYQTLFENASDQVAIGESSTSYLSTPSTPRRIKEKLPEAKLVAILRNPADRAYSAYKRKVLRGHESISNFEEALRQEPLRIQNDWHPSFFYKLKGFYYGQLKRYFEIFDKSKIKIYLYEDLTDNPAKMLQDLFQFLEVDVTFLPDISKKFNTHKYIPKSHLVEKITKRKNTAHPILKPLFSSKLGQVALSSLENWNKIEFRFLPVTREHLIKEYREDILKVESLLDRDLSNWLR